MAEYDCPACSAAFDSRRGLGVHRSRVHDERLPNRECEECGSQFYSSYEKKYCSEECRERRVTFVGSENPNYDGGKERTECVLCEAEFTFYPSEKPGLYCPACVETEDWREPPVIEGDDHPRWSGGKIELSCAACGELIKRYPSHVTGCNALWERMSVRLALGGIHRRGAPKLERWRHRQLRAGLESHPAESTGA